MALWGSPSYRPTDTQRQPSHYPGLEPKPGHGLGVGSQAYPRAGVASAGECSMSCRDRSRARLPGSIFAEPNACAVHGVETGGSVVPGLRGKGVGITSMAPAALPPPTSHPPLSWETLTLYLPSAGCSCPLAAFPQTAQCRALRKAFSYLASPLSERRAGPVSIWGLV